MFGCEAKLATASKRSMEGNGAGLSSEMWLWSLFQQVNRRCEASAVNLLFRSLIREASPKNAELVKPIYTELSSVASPKWPRPLREVWGGMAPRRRARCGREDASNDSIVVAKPVL